MKQISSWLRQNSLFLTFFFFSIYTYGSGVSIAQTGTINNTATARTGNQPEELIESNTVTLTASQANLRIIKTGDRAAAEPGDTIIYRLAIENTGNAATESLTISDRLPVGLRFISKSLKGTIQGGTGDRTVNLTANQTSSHTISIATTEVLQANEILNVFYAVEVTPDAIRGDGINVAQVNTSPPSSFRVRIRGGILSDCGTLIGRVFVDKNFDGEQQPNEPGVPNAVIFMDDGNRIVTDAKGLYSLPGVVSGSRTAALDLSSLPGYALAPNKYFIERNSQSRLVKIAPNSMVRVNFAVTPAFSEEKR
ncbi:hypothetical protein [Mastigocoleus sp. MO_188.B34]|uniref:hypothetical protein n=1 Tax=Mastigocoleus sp. MO_188.B34 TaxID=3036635 RepID=UPI002627FD15|nr:hypothetical protein [Mastigocoleus sp. MO_188.B34]MDJ0693748.1 hypothetical protein [Mastigocoleus sp. MO_188.B34]